MTDYTTLLVDHYHRSAERVAQHWRERNRVFLYLLVTITLAVILTWQGPNTASVLMAIIAKFIGLPENSITSHSASDVSVIILESFFPLVVFYLMIWLYHRNADCIRGYAYLGKLETEIRDAFKAHLPQIAFTREGAFYFANRGWSQDFVKWGYLILIGLLLILFSFHKIIIDFPGSPYTCDLQKFAGWVFNLVIFIFVFFFFGAYSFERVIQKKNGNGEEKSESRPAR